MVTTMLRQSWQQIKNVTGHHLCLRSNFICSKLSIRFLKLAHFKLPKAYAWDDLPHTKLKFKLCTDQTTVTCKESSSRKFPCFVSISLMPLKWQLPVTVLINGADSSVYTVYIHCDIIGINYKMTLQNILLLLMAIDIATASIPCPDTGEFCLN